MAESIRSGAFLQQCWSVHPLCLTVKRVESERIVVLTCSSCRTGASGDHHLARSPGRHRLWIPPRLNRALRSRMDSWRSRPVWAPMLPALSVREMDVFKMRCGSAVQNVGRSTT